MGLNQILEKNRKENIMREENNRIVYEIEGQEIGEIEFKELDKNTAA